MPVILKSGVDSNTATVDSNKQLLVNLPLDETQAGYVVVTSEIDNGLVSGTRLVRPLKVNEDSALKTGEDNIFFNENFNGTTINSGQWLQTLNNMNAAQSGGFLTLNSTSQTTSGYYAILNSYKTVPLISGQSTVIQFRANIVNPTATDMVMELGAGFASTTSTPTDGVFFRWSGGQLVGVINNNGSEQQTANFTTIPDSGTTHTYTIIFSWSGAEFYIDDIMQKPRLSSPATVGQTTRSSAYPLVARIYNTGTASGAPQISLASTTVFISGAPLVRPYPHMRAACGENCNTGCTTWETLGTQSNWTNSPTIGTATLSNTADPTGPNVNNTTLGGLYLFSAQAGSTTDWIVFDYTVPAASASVTGKTLFVTDVRIDCVVTGAAIATTPTIMAWALAFGSSAISLATTDGAGTKAPRKVPLGVMSWPIGAVVGTAGNAININLQTPIPVFAGQHLHIIEQTVVGTATEAELFFGNVMLNGYFE